LSFISGKTLVFGGAVSGSCFDPVASLVPRVPSIGSGASRPNSADHCAQYMKEPQAIRGFLNMTATVAEKLSDEYLTTCGQTKAERGYFLGIIRYMVNS
jgi:hypothetical protein